MTIDQQFNTVNDKLQQLLKQYHRLLRENERLKEELHVARNNELQWKTRTGELQQQIGVMKLATGDMNEKDRKEFEKKINQYVKEIDKCISFLSQ